MDWNWFFSALSQSCAAVVGIMGAFVFAKLVSNQADMKHRRASFDSLRVGAARLVAQLERRRFKWYNETKMKIDIFDLQGILLKEPELREPMDYYEELDFSPFLPKSDVLEVIRIEVESERQRRTDSSAGDRSASRSIKGGLINRERTRLEAERYQINDIAVEIRIHASQVRRFMDESKARPESSPLVTASIVVCILLFLVGVVYPLGMLPADGFEPNNLSLNAIPQALFSYRGLLLGVIALLFVATMVGFGVINKRLVLSDEQIDQLHAYGETSRYSRYLKICERNMEERV